MKDILIGNHFLLLLSKPSCLIILDNGVSGDVPNPTKVTAGTGGSSGDRLAAIEGKLARLETRPKTDQKDRRMSNSKPMIHGRDVCWDFNSKNGCKRQTIPGGCKADKREYANACNVWVKAKAAYCLMNHGRKDHR